MKDVTDFSSLDLSRDRDQFVRELLRELSGVLQDVVGMEDARGFISVVGNRLGSVMNREYQSANENKRLNTSQIAGALVDLKRRIEGGFSVESLSEGEIVLVNTQCPFGEYVKDRPSLCMMTSNVFGRIAADNRGYASVSIQEAIARGDAGCRVVVSFVPKGGLMDEHTNEYFELS